MGAVAPSPCSEPVFASRGLGAGSAGSPPAAFPESSRSSDDEEDGASSAASSAAEEERRLSFGELGPRQPPSELLLEWLPVHQSRLQKHRALRRELRLHRASAAELREEAHTEGAAEVAIRTATEMLRDELAAVEVSAMREAELRDGLAEELAAREARGHRLQQEVEQAGARHGDRVAEAANLREDVARLWKEEAWAKRHKCEADVRRDGLAAYLREAEHGLKNRVAASATVRLGTGLAGTANAHEVKAEGKVEARAAELARRGEAAVEELLQHRTELRLELMREEHHRSYLEHEVNAAQRGLSIYRGRREPAA